MEFSTNAAVVLRGDYTLEYARLRGTMETAETEHLASPEVPGTQLLFCITPDA